MAGVNMRLEAGAIRCDLNLSYSVDSFNYDIFSELHWHQTAEVRKAQCLNDVLLIKDALLMISGHMY